jgi:hypothetical protein
LPNFRAILRKADGVFPRPNEGPRTVPTTTARPSQPRWSKKLESSPTLITYASGPNAGAPAPMVRGQIFIQVVQVGTNVTWTVGSGASPSPSVESATG